MPDNCLPTLTQTDLPVVVDLFSGCGGLSLGFQQAGFHIVYGADFQQDACDTANYNLCWKYGKESTYYCKDITAMDASEISPYTTGKKVIVIGGPPCQAYSIAGKAKLRSLGAERAHLNDKRGFLFQDFVRIALDLNAAAVIMENVPESASYGNLNVPQKVSKILSESGYTVKWSILNAANYGVPQTRERMILVAVRSDISCEFEFPLPKCDATDALPATQRSKVFSDCPNYVSAPEAKAEMHTGHRIIVREALSDLPVLMKSAEQKYHLIPLNTVMKYSTAAEYEYQKEMRKGTDAIGVTANGFRNNSRDFKTFDRMKPGDNYVVALQIAEDRLNEVCSALGVVKSEKSLAYTELRKSIVPPYEKDNFPDKWRRLDPDRPSPTVVAHMSKDTYAFIHPWEPRGLSVREAARMQSFPDCFQFQGSMGEAYRQIGNAVPPILSRAIAVSVKRLFEEM